MNLSQPNSYAEKSIGRLKGYARASLYMLQAFLSFHNLEPLSEDTAECLLCLSEPQRQFRRPSAADRTLMTFIISLPCCSLALLLTELLPNDRLYS